MPNEYKSNQSAMAEVVAFHRANESFKPADERICYDQYAVRFLSPETLEVLNDPVKLKAFTEQVGHLAQGVGNSVRARVKYFDDFIKRSVDEGFEQLVILGAGYDTRAYRIEELENVKIFEVDHPDTQSFKIQKIKEIFGSTPNPVVYVPVNLETQKLSQSLFNKGYNSSKKTLFVMEGLLMYLPPNTVDKILSFIATNSSKGSTILFDYFHQCMVDGTCEVGRIFRSYAELVGETLQFGLTEEIVDEFLSKCGFSCITNVTSEDYKKAYFHGINENREVSNMLYFVHAVVSKGNSN